LAGSLLLVGTVFAEAPKRDVTFISTSDSHYVSVGTRHKHRNADNRKTILAINAVNNVNWPASLGGGLIDPPRGMMLLGDVIDDGDAMFEGINKGQRQYEYFLADCGLDGTDGVLKYPVYETWGNHDGPPIGKERFGFNFQAWFKERNVIRKKKGLIANLSDIWPVNGGRGRPLQRNCVAGRIRGEGDTADSRQGSSFRTFDREIAD